MEMKNMKMSAEERKESYPTPATVESNQYPWGLCITLDNETIQKLGIKGLPAVESTMMLHARVEVKTTNSSDEAGGEKRRSMSLQITDMGLEEENKKETADALYGG